MTMNKFHTLRRYFMLVLACISFVTAAHATSNEQKKALANVATVKETEKETAAASVTEVVLTEPNEPSTNIVVEETQVLSEQPTTVVSAAPLTLSKAEELKKAREKAEIETEQKIVEKLERSRLEDEQKRLDKIFNASAATASTTDPMAPSEPAAPSEPPAPPAPPALEKVVIAQDGMVATPAPLTEMPEASKTIPVVEAPVATFEETPQVVKADREEAQVEEKKALSQFGVGGVLSTISYPDAFNTASDFGAGVTMSWTNDKRFTLEGAFIYSQHTIDDSFALYREVDQYNFVASARYAIMPRALTPVLGLMTSYTRREYNDMYDWGFASIEGRRSAASDSLDAGLLIGAEYRASQSIVLGLEYRWFTNLSARYDYPRAFNRAIYESNNRLYRPLEEIDYDLVGFTLKFMF